MTNGVKLMFAECCKNSAGAGSSGSSRGSPGGFEPGHRWSRVLRRSTAHRRRTYPGDRDQLQSARQDHVKHKCFLKTIAKVRRSHNGYKNTKTKLKLIWMIVLTRYIFFWYRHIDFSEALKTPGVVDVITADDIPGKKFRTFIGCDEDLLTQSEVWILLLLTLKC